ncbi:hypothetical protein MTR67_025769, partial [Solanum verrucosum]
MVKMMTQINLFSKHVMGSGTNSVMARTNDKHVDSSGNKHETEKADEDLAEETDEEELRVEEHGIAEILTELHETEEVILQAMLE